MVGYPIVRRRPHHPGRQRLERLVAPPLRLGHLVARLPLQHTEGPCHGRRPAHRAHRRALLGLEEPLCGLHDVPRAGERCTEAEVRLGLVGPQGDGLAVGPGGSACILLREVPRAFSQQPLVLVARLRGVPCCPLRDLAIPLLHHPTILSPLPMHLHLLVIHRVPLPSARVPRAVDAAPVRRWHLELDANRANIPKQARLTATLGGAPPLSAAGRHGGGGRRGGRLRGLALRLQRLQRRQRHTDLLGARSQVWLLLSQLGEQRREAEAGISQPQSADGLEKGFGHWCRAQPCSATSPPHAALQVWGGKA
eukprot:scaffold4719_cov55-Phaeocystis_antarctica.AAC.2